MNSEAKSSLGARVRALRKERDLSQRGLAEQAGLSPNAISLIERDEISPSVATLQRLASALRVRMAYFFDDPAGDQVIHSRSGLRPAIADKGVTIEATGLRLEGQQMEPFVIVAEPLTDSGKDAVVHAGHELVFCLSGRVEYEIDGVSYGLEPGDQLLFEARLPHRWQNLGPETAHLLLVLQAADGPHDPARRHFTGLPSVADLG